MTTTRTHRHVRADRTSVYRALLDADAVQRWMVPDGMTSVVHEFDPCEGGKFRISLTYDDPTGTGKSDPRTDTFHGRFDKLVPDSEVVQVVEFETADPSMQGEMTIIYRLVEADGGTDVIGIHQHLPPGVAPADNELGWLMSMAKLAGLVEAENIDIRDAGRDDVAEITAIQNALIATTAIEWTDELHEIDERMDWFDRQRAAGNPILVAIASGAVVGWASYGPFRDSLKWPGYRLTVEHTVHVARSHWGSGVGRALMEALIDRATTAGLHVMIGAVDGENLSSIRFHERLGFREVARMPQIGTKFGRWLDLVLLQRVLGDSPPPP